MTLLKSFLCAALTAIALVSVAVESASANPGGGTVISQAAARARGANTVDRDSCLSNCRSRSNDQSVCPNVCLPGKCFTTRAGGAYCVK